MTDFPSLPPLAAWPGAHRRLVVLFVVTATAGFLLALFFVELNTRMTPSGIVSHYNGQTEAQMEAGAGIQFEKSTYDMALTTHNHFLGLSPLFFLVGFLYLLTGVRAGKVKMIIAAEPLISLWLTFGSLWLMRFIHPSFVYLAMISGLAMTLSFFWMALIILKTCRQPAKE